MRQTTCERQFSKACEAQGTPLVQTTEAAPLIAFPAWLMDKTSLEGGGHCSDCACSLKYVKIVLISTQEEKPWQVSALGRKLLSVPTLSPGAGRGCSHRVLSEGSL